MLAATKATVCAIVNTYRRFPVIVGKDAIPWQRQANPRLIRSQLVFLNGLNLCVDPEYAWAKVEPRQAGRLLF